MYKVIWLTGLPSSGKTTIANELNMHLNGVLLDGDEIRGSHISSKLGFSKEDRDTNLFRVAEIAKICSKTSYVICSFVSPYRSTRNEIKNIVGSENFVEVFVNCDIDECIDRDVKGLYKKAIAGEIPNFTGISDPYEIPTEPDIILDTKSTDVKWCVDKILENLEYYSKIYALYIGRWNGVYHNGHAYIVEQALNENKNVLMAVRDIEPDSNNPWSAYQTKAMLDHYYDNEPRVKIIVIPDIDSVNYGRGVGYAINEIKVEKEIAGISGTKCRELLAANNIEELAKYVPEKIVKYLQC